MATDWPSEEVLTELGVEAGMWDWYWDEFNKVYGPMDVGVTNEGRCGEFNDAYVQALNEGIPQQLLTVDEAIELLDTNLCK